MDVERRTSAFQTILGMFRLTNTPTVPVTDEDNISDMDEPPDSVPVLNMEPNKQTAYLKSLVKPPCTRRESLLTKAIAGGANPAEMNPISTRGHGVSRAFSTASSQSVPSTAELTSDCELTSPARSVSPSPPPPAARLTMPLAYKQPGVPANKVIIAPVTKDDKPTVVDVGEAAVEKTLGRKRCIMFACVDKPEEPVKKETPPVSPTTQEPAPEPQPRKCRLTFVCPTRQDSTTSINSATNKAHTEQQIPPPSPAPLTTTSQQPIPTSHPAEDLPVHKPIPKKPAPVPAFHEFGSSQDETDSWVDQPSGSHRPKLTLKDVMSKEIAIRRIGEEAEAEAEEEEREQDEIDNELDEDNDGEDDFAPSDDDNESDGGNESDDEGGFADSDDESDAGSDYQFWAPAATTAATSMDNLTHFSSRQRLRSNSLESTPSQSSGHRTKIFPSRKFAQSKAIRMRPGTPELPDSTDFVCGTLDEDRPLEAAYISCREQRKRERHVPIPQDIDPSFPTTDPEEEEDEEDEIDDEESEPVWVRDQFGAMDDDDRGRRRPSAIRLSPGQVAARQAKAHEATAVTTQQPPKRVANRSPAPQRLRSPPPRRLFGHSPPHARSPPPPGRYHSPRGSPANMKLPLGITINRLAQRPGTNRTASLPQTPNPFFRNWKRGSPATSRIPSGAVTPGTDEAVRSDLHVRGPVDIVIGLEKKRQKRKEKYWRQHCRKAAREHTERKTIPGRGVERMKELGLECAERTRGYGLGQQAKLVLSL